MSEKRLFGLIGHPLSHSFSAAYFNEKFKKEDLACTYVNFDMAAMPDLKLLAKMNPKLVGLNVTVPYKEVALLQMHEVDEKARQIGAINVVKIEDEKFFGYNTDFLAFKETIQPLLPRKTIKALVLGTGGASKAVCFALAELAIDYKRVSRKSSKDILSYQDVTSYMMRDFDVIINTTPLGNFPQVDEFPPIPFDALMSNQLLFDLTYNPPESSFLKKGLEKGCKTMNGYDMLMRQADLSWEIWNQ
jgi:shikimate dehydrogenase